MNPGASIRAVVHYSSQKFGCGYAIGSVIVSHPKEIKVRVSQEATSRFIVLYIKLLYYAGQKRDILESTMSFDEFIREPLDMKVGCRDAIYTPTPLLDDFLADQHTNLSDEEQDIIGPGMRRGIQEDYREIRNSGRLITRL